MNIEVRVDIDNDHGLSTSITLRCKPDLEDIEEKLDTAVKSVMNAYRVAWLAHGPDVSNV